MKSTIIVSILLSAISANALPEKFVKAIHQIESSGRVGMVLGDYCKKTKTHRSIGPLQIQKAYFVDSGVKGNYLQCTNLSFSMRVMEGYFRRYCPKALRDNDLETLARVHNGGPNGKNNPKTQIYWRKVQKAMRPGRLTKYG